MNNIPAEIIEEIIIFGMTTWDHNDYQRFRLSCKYINGIFKKLCVQDYVTEHKYERTVKLSRNNFRYQFKYKQYHVLKGLGNPPPLDLDQAEYIDLALDENGYLLNHYFIKQIFDEIRDEYALHEYDKQRGEQLKMVSYTRERCIGNNMIKFIRKYLASGPKLDSITSTDYETTVHVYIPVNGEMAMNICSVHFNKSLTLHSNPKNSIENELENVEKIFKYVKNLKPHLSESNWERTCAFVTNVYK